jgi:regulatory protein
MPDSELFRASLAKAMALCASREYCESEVHAKLALWGLNDSESYRLTGLLKKDNFINEERYATSFARDKFKYNKWGRLKISAHLKAKRIPPEIIRLALESIDSDTYKSTLESLLSAHRRTIKAKNQYDLKAKLMRYGLSKGFESGILYELLNMSED